MSWFLYVEYPVHLNSLPVYDSSLEVLFLLLVFIRYYVLSVVSGDRVLNLFC
jgi:hypothetical protein